MLTNAKNLSETVKYFQHTENVTRCADLGGSSILFKLDICCGKADLMLMFSSIYFKITRNKGSKRSQFSFQGALNAKKKRA